MSNCTFCKSSIDPNDYPEYEGENGLCDFCFFEVGIWEHEQLWIFEETAIEYGWTKETSPIEVIDPTDEIWKDEEYYWVREVA